MARLTVFLYNMIVLVSFIRSVPSQNTTTPMPSATAIPSNNTIVQPSATSTTPTASSNTAATPGHGNSTTPSPSSVAPTAVPTSPSPTEKPDDKKFTARISLNKTYESDYDNLSSPKYRTFTDNFETNVTFVLRARLSYVKTVEVTRLSNGSVVVDFDIVVKKSSNATAGGIKNVLQDGTLGTLGYEVLGEITVREVQPLSTVIAPSSTATGTVPSNTAAPTPTPTCSTKATEIWDKAIVLATPLGTFIIVIVAVALVLILLIALICVCCKYRQLKKKTHFPDHMAINDSEWIRSNDDLLMWERNLRASEVKTNNGIANRPFNEKRP